MVIESNSIIIILTNKSLFEIATNFSNKASIKLIYIYIVINIFVAIIVKKSEEAYKYIQSEFPNKVTQNEILDEIKEIRKKIENLEKISNNKEKYLK